MTEVYLKNLLSERRNQENEERHSWLKKEPRIIQQDSNPKRGKSHKKRKTRKRRCTFSSLQSRFPPRRKKKKSRKQSKNKLRRRFPCSSWSSSSSCSSSSESEEEDQETKWFHIVSNEDWLKWDLPSELASYANTQFEKYIPKKSFHEAIYDVHLVQIT